mmetsp:Transcript_4910/g.12357  ORF Transcript_4910/g.12357 Transcript_4910/m.12357 type:complete len:466 (+) Transcript_4910:721-2118(+)
MPPSGHSCCSIPGVLLCRALASRRNQANPRYKTSSRRQRAPAGGRPHNGRLHAAVAATGAAVLEAPRGHEGDDLIAAVAQAAAEHGSRVVVASRDSDMQALIGERVSWLELMERPTPSNPCACQLHGLQRFQTTYGFDPEVYAHYLALVGKPEAGVKTVGVGENAARRLIQCFGTIQAVIAAGQRKELSGYRPQVVDAFQPDPSRDAVAPGAKMALSNLDVFSLGLPADLLESCLARGGLSEASLRPQRGPCHSASDPRCAFGAGWGGLGAPWVAGLDYPPHAAHLAECHVELNSVSAALCRMGIPHSVRRITPTIDGPKGAAGGLLLDVLVAAGWRDALAVWAGSRIVRQAIGERPELGALLSPSQSTASVSHSAESPVAIRLLGELDYLESSVGKGHGRDASSRQQRQQHGCTKNYLGVLRRAGWVVVTLDCKEWRERCAQEEETLLAEALLATERRSGAGQR